jgi:hypothetical protein
MLEFLLTSVATSEERRRNAPFDSDDSIFEIRYCRAIARPAIQPVVQAA